MNQNLNREITFSSLIKFTLPSIAMMVVMSLYTVVDGTFVSRLIGTGAFSAINIVYPFFSIVLALGTMFGTGITAIASRKLGEGKKQEARENVSFILMFTVIIGVLISVFALVFLKDIIYLSGANEEIYQDCYNYAFPLIFFLPASILQIQFQSLFVANGKPQIGLAVTIMGGLANVFLDYFFIAVCKIGISGAAIATGIGYCIPAFYGILYFSCNRRAELCFVKFKADFNVLAKAVTNGSSEMVSNLSGSVTTFLFNIIMMHFVGQEGVAAISIILYMDFVLIAVNLGYSMGAAPLFSYNYGAGNKERLKKLYRLSTIFCAVIGIGVTAGTVVFAGPLTSIFTQKGTYVYDLAVTGLLIYAASYLFKGYNIFASAMFTAFGNGKISALLSFMRTLVFLTTALLGLSALFGLDGVWFASPAAELLAFLLSLYFTVKQRRTYYYA